MRISILISAIVLALSSFQTSVAAPHALYNPATGNVQLVVDGDYYPNLTIISPSGSLTNSDELIDIPGAASDRSEFPFAYTYLRLKSGTWNTGNTVVPHTPANELIFEYRDQTGWILLRGEIIVVPEPATLTLIVAGVAAILGRRRR